MLFSLRGLEQWRESHADATRVLGFGGAGGRRVGDRRGLRLRVDGVESILVDRTLTPPQFRNDKVTVV